MSATFGKVCWQLRCIQLVQKPRNMHSTACWGQNLACLGSEAIKHKNGLVQPESVLQAALL